MTNIWFAILKSNLKSVFNIRPVASEKFSTPIFFIYLFIFIFLGAGLDENLVINFLWPKFSDI